MLANKSLVHQEDINLVYFSPNVDPNFYTERIHTLDLEPASEPQYPPDQEQKHSLPVQEKGVEIKESEINGIDQRGFLLTKQLSSVPAKQQHPFISLTLDLPDNCEVFQCLFVFFSSPLVAFLLTCQPNRVLHFCEFLATGRGVQCLSPNLIRLESTPRFISSSSAKKCCTIHAQCTYENQQVQDRYSVYVRHL